MAHIQDGPFGGAAASPLRPGLQGCDISDLEFDSATDPKEGGNGDLLHATPFKSIRSNLIICYPKYSVSVSLHFFLGVVLRAFYNGTEAAVKRPRIKVTLNPRDLNNFKREVTTMCKASSD
ncbi:MAG: hypothetical protein NWR85_12615 [Limnohabitans sp.]|nr:hypothetical protein [Limnohabitans sp.]